MKVGLLFPMSNTYPGIGQDFMDGIHSLFKQQEIHNVTILKEGVAFGGVEKEVYLKAEKLLIADDVDVLVAYIDERVLPMLHPLVMATGKLLLVVNPGANHPQQWIPQPGIIQLNLQHAFLCRLTGALAAATATPKAALATTYYDCGYLHSAAMVNHFMEQGGSIEYNYVNNQAYNEAFEINALLEFLTSRTDCSNLLCVFDTLPASMLYQLLNRHWTGRPLHLFASPMMLQAQAIAAVGDAAPYNVQGYLPWYPGLNTALNTAFVKTCTRPATLFSLLGWEVALVLQALLQANITGNADEAVAHLKTITLQSPRGTLQLDAATQIYVAPVAKYTLPQGQHEPQIEWITDVETEWRSFTAQNIQGPVTGWTNTYLCY